MKRKLVYIILAFALLLSGCAKPIPQEQPKKAEHVEFSEETMTKAPDEYRCPEWLEVGLIVWDDEKVAVEITNNGDQAWEYGRGYHYEVLLGASWYYVPSQTENLAVTAEAFVLNVGETVSMTFGFEDYGKLPEGAYRLVLTDGVTVSNHQTPIHRVYFWDTSKLHEVSEPIAPENIEMKLISWENGIVKVKITNNTNEVLTFGEWFSLDVLLDGKWYNVPQAPGNWDRFENENIIVPQTSIIKGYYLDMFGKIPDGTYRIVTPNGAVTNEDDHPWEAELQDDELVSVCEYIPTIFVDMKYATEDNFVGQALYEHPYALLRLGTVKKLMEAEEKLNELGYRIKIWDAYRPVSAQEKLWEICPDPRYVSNPATGYLGHSRGNTIDLTIVDYDTLEEVEMPTGFDDFTAKADRDYSDVSKKAAENSALLEMVMTECGFTGYSGEWWHYSDTTEYPVIK